MGLKTASSLAVTSAILAVCYAQYQQQQPQYQQGYQNRSRPYGNYSSQASMYGNYSKAPQYPPTPYNTSAKYQNGSNYMNQYQGDPFAWHWDHEHQSAHQYDQDAQNWIYGNINAAWAWAWNAWNQKVGQYSGYGQTCGYTSNQYDLNYENRHSKQADVLVLMAQFLWDNYNGDKSKLIPAMTNINPYQLNIPLVQDCLAENYVQWQGCQQYQNSKYSRPDQICNNLGYPTWGAWLDIAVRITSIWNYNNGIWQPLQYNAWPNYDGSFSPVMEAKALANALDNDNYGQCYNMDVTMLHAYFTQFIAHDIIKSAPYTVTGYNGQQVKPECCRTPDNCQHYSCKSWHATAQTGGGGNGYGSSYNSYPVCEGIVDNLPGIDYCTPLPKDSTNLQTAYVDASQVYGPSCYEAAKVRSWRKGKLRVNKGKYGLYSKNVLLPDDPSPDTDECDISYPDGDLKCLMSGDKRVNQHPGMLALSTLWLRLHNRIASSCAKWLEKYYLSEDVLDEICYQEVRRIIQAVTQNIFYRDHLPVELGPYITSNPNYGLSLDYVLPYDPAAHASVWPEYVYAAGRLHSVISHWSQAVDPNKANQGYQEPDSWYGVYDWFRKAYGIMYNKHKLNELVSNSLYDPEQCYDADFVPELRNVNAQYGGPNIDMFWTNIMRGREMALPWYTQVRDWCGMGYLTDWSQLQGIWSQNCLNVLPGLLGNVKNVELYIGMICENPLPGAVVGPTAACVLQRQYYNLREGDRWFFDRNGFTYDQLAVVKKFNLGKILCITTNLDYVTENVFRTPNSYTNKYQSCNAYDDITEDDLSVLWSTIPYAAGDYRTCKEYGGYGPQQAGYQNSTYNGYGGQYQQQNYTQQASYQAPQYQQSGAPYSG